MPSTAHFELFRCQWCGKILSLDFTDDIIQALHECKKSRLPVYFPAFVEGPPPVNQHWVLGADYSEIWLKELPSSDHYSYIRLSPDIKTILTFAAPDAVFCAWASEELGIEIGERYFWAVVGAIMFEQLHGDGFQIEGFLSWVARKNFGELIRSSTQITMES